MRAALTLRVLALLGRPGQDSKGTDSSDTIEEEGDKERNGDGPAATGANAKNAKALATAERAFLCAVAVGLLWCTSLPVAHSLVALQLPRRPWADVAAAAEAAWAVVEDRAAAHSTCMRQREASCGVRVESAVAAEQLGVDGVAARNTATLAGVEGAAAACAADRTDALVYLGFLHDSGQIAMEDVRRNASEGGEEARCASLDALLAQERAASSALQTGAAFQQESAGSVAALHASVDARAQYDEDYLAGRRAVATSTAATMRADVARSAARAQAALEGLRAKNDELYACLGQEECAPGLGRAIAQARTAQREAMRAYRDMEEGAEVLRNSLHAFSNAYHGFIDSTLTKIVLWIVSPPSFNVGELMGAAFGDRFRPPYSQAELEAELARQQLEAAAELNRTVEVHRAETDALLRAESGNASSDAAGQTGLTLTVDALLGDYAPPPADADAEVSRFAQASDVFMTTLGSAVQGLGSLADAAPRADVELDAGEQDPLKLLQAAANGTSSESIASFDPRTWELFLYEELSLSALVAQWADLSQLAFLCDFLFRCLHTLHIVAKYMKLSKVVTPPVDVRAEEDKARQGGGGSAAGGSPRRTPQQLAAHVLLHPMTGVLLGGCFLWLLGSAFLALYAPFFARFVEGCVEASAPSPGTLLTRNVETLARGFATREGDSVAAAAIDAANLRNAELCQTRAAASRSLLLAHAQNMSAHGARWADARRDMVTLDSCLHLDRVDDYFETRVLGSSCFGFDAAAQGAPDQAQPDVVGAVFNCSALPTCSFQCAEPSRDVVALWTWGAACELEAFMHRAFFGWVFAATLFALINVGRVVFVRGLRFWLWRTLSPHNRFAFIADVQYCTSLNGDGGGDDSDESQPEQGQPEQHVVRKRDVVLKIEEALKGFQRKGIVHMLLAAAIVATPILALRSVANVLKS